MSEQFDFDVAVIGAGSAGYAAARACSAAGLKTAILEGGREVGGLCILRGCMPTKAILYSAEIAHLARHAALFGIKVPQVEPILVEIMERKRRLIQNFADYRRTQLETARFTFLRARAAFKDPHTLTLSTGGELRAAHFIIATGSIVSPSPLQHLNDVGFMTSDDALVLETLPKSIIVLGGGAVAVEFAQFFQRVGVETILVQRSEHLLRDEETAAAQMVADVFRREGMQVFTDTKLCGARLQGSSKVVAFEHEGQIREVAAEEIFFGLGRIPNLVDLELERAGVNLSYGRLLVDSEMQTNQPHIFGAGDCTGLYEIVHIAIQQAEIAAHNIIHPSSRLSIDYRLLTSVVFTDPQIGRVGLTEQQAQRKKIPYLAASYPFNDHGKSMIMEANDGFVKLLADPKTGEILGGTCAGPSGGELIHEIIAAMHKRMTVRESAQMPHYHPTLAEIWTYPAEELADQIDEKNKS